jgi:hypothetical protein
MAEFSIDSIIDDSVDDSGFIEVMAPSGTPVQVMTEPEAQFYNQMAQRYQLDNSFKNISDILELDRILIMEVMCYRWSNWILMESDYRGRSIDPTNLQKYIESYSKEIRGIKRDLGMDKSSRDKGREASVADYIHNLGLRAKEFGVVRNKQAIEAITILMELRGLITLWENSDEDERREFDANLEDVIEWIKQQFDRFSELDHELRENQRIWIREI